MRARDAGPAGSGSPEQASGPAAEQPSQSGGVTLQINLSPGDLPHARPILEHQLRQWAGQVDRITFTLDLHRSGGWRARGWDERRPEMERLLEELCSRIEKAQVQPVDYSPEAVETVHSALIDEPEMPRKDYQGAPVYAYLYALVSAQDDYVLHSDSDMLFGGGSQTWVAEALRLLQERPDTLIASPYPGPPPADGRLPDRLLRRHVSSWAGQAAGAQPPAIETIHSGPALRFRHMSDRVFLIDRRRLFSKVGRFRLPPIGLLHSVMAVRDRNPRVGPWEVGLSQAMAERGLERVDFLGSAPGMWSLHPPHRSESFYRLLPELVRRVEEGDVPEAQRGDYDVNDSLVPWRAEVRRNRARRWLGR